MAANTEHPAVTNFREYLAIKSVHPNPDYAGCVKFLTRLGKEIGLETDVFEPVPGKPVVVLTKRGTDSSLSSILLNSHMDVVPVFMDKWNRDPFAAEKDSDGNIYARGAQDMKCVGIMYLEAIRNLSSVTLPRTIHVSFVPDEEIGGTDGMDAWTKTPHFKNLNVGFGLDEAAPFPTPQFLLFNNERSIWTVKLICKGNSGHGSLFHSGTAGESLNKVLNRIMEFRESEEKKFKENPLSWPSICTSINLTMINGGVQHNVLPEEIVVTFDCRLAPSLDFEEFESWFHKICKEVGGGTRVEFPSKDPKWPTTHMDNTNKFWVAFKSAIDKLGIQLMPSTCPGATDARYLRRMGIPALGFTPINETPVLIHDHNEFVNEDKFLRGIEIYMEIIKELGNLGK